MNDGNCVMHTARYPQQGRKQKQMISLGEIQLKKNFK